MDVVTKCVAAPAGQNNDQDTGIQFVTAFFFALFSTIFNISEYCRIYVNYV